MKRKILVSILFATLFQFGLFAQDGVKVHTISSEKIFINGEAEKYFEIVPGNYDLKIKGSKIACRLKLRRTGTFDIDKYLKYHPCDKDEYLTFDYASNKTVYLYDSDGFRITDVTFCGELEFLNYDQNGFFQKLLEPAGTEFYVILDFASISEEEKNQVLAAADIGEIRINNVNFDFVSF